MSDIESLAERLRATAERPVDRTANRWLGEAQAITEDLVQAELDEETVQQRLKKVDGLLAEVDETGDDEADANVDAATAILDELLE